MPPLDESYKPNRDVVAGASTASDVLFKKESGIAFPVFPIRKNDQARLRFKRFFDMLISQLRA